ncbi:MAG: hypothetical protein ACRCS3_00890, partial [Paracoccaceae bacterium]
MGTVACGRRLPSAVICVASRPTAATPTGVAAIIIIIVIIVISTTVVVVIAIIIVLRPRSIQLPYRRT